MKLTCIRHTKVDVPAGICYGQTDVPLAPSFGEEMGLVASHLKTDSFDRIFASPLSRCRQLANYLFPNHEIHIEKRLKELHFGAWENKGWQEIFHTEEGRYWMNNFLVEPCPGGESYPQFRQRVASLIDDIKAMNVRNVVFVTHAGVIRLVKAILENQTLEDVLANFNPDYGGIYSFQITTS